MRILEFENLGQKVGIENDFNVRRISAPIVTEETFDEFLAMSKTDQLALKDVGGFIAAVSTDGTRKKEAIVARTMLTLDLDDADVTTLETIKNNVFCKLWLHSTRKHTATTPRFRLIVPLENPVPGDDYEILTRFFASEMNILEACDTASFRRAQLMLWPSVSSDMREEFVFYEAPLDKLLNPVEFLAKFDTSNLSKWPRKRSETKAIAREVTDVNDDPRSKSGVVGAFCKAFTVSEAIQRFLPDVYSKSKIGDNRFDFIGANSVGGLVVYDDLFAYSFHANKDVAAGKHLNAFDLVRIHKFGELDLQAEQGTPFVRLPSVLKMKEFAQAIPAVKNILGESASCMGVKETSFIYTADGKLKANVHNICCVLNNDKSFHGIRKNLFSNEIEVTADLPWRKAGNTFTEDDLASFSQYLSSKRLDCSNTMIMNAVRATAANRGFHPVRAKLENLPLWDGIFRLETYLVEYLGAEDNPYVRYISKTILVAAIARIYKPAIKFDWVPVLVGPQGCGKSTIFARLFEPWYSDSLTLEDMRSKAAIEKVTGVWCLEISELAGMAKADVETVKAYITRQVDKTRPAYGHSVIKYERQNVIVATTNQVDGFLRDSTGNRRFCPIEVSGTSQRKPWDLTTAEIDQIWAEAFSAYNEGNFCLHLCGNIQQMALDEQRRFIQNDDRSGLVESYLKIPIPKNWLTLPEETRKRYISKELGAPGFENSSVGVDCIDMVEPFEVRKHVCNLEIFTEAFGKKIGDYNKHRDATEISQIMSSIHGWTQAVKKCQTVFGTQRCYLRED